MTQESIFGVQGQLERTGLIIGCIILGIYLLLLIYAVVNYIVFSKSLSILAKRRGVSHPGLIWVPFARNWQIGNIADEYDLRKDGRDRKWRKYLMWFAGVGYGSFFAVYGASIAVGIYSGLNGGDVSGTIPPTGLIIGLLALIIPYYVGIMGVGILRIVAYYRIFESCSWKKPMKYLLIAMLVPFALPFVFRHCRNMDNGLYPSVPALAAPKNEEDRNAAPANKAPENGEGKEQDI